mmetsp:Transcript_13143/g.28483  ORF Transcript_13143/g.28483 Transcript_13143/m.28483 type:complete len:356 (-) Transcript_13143:249-1316(-)
MGPVNPDRTGLDMVFHEKLAANGIDDIFTFRDMSETNKWHVVHTWFDVDIKYMDAKMFTSMIDVFVEIVKYNGYRTNHDVERTMNMLLSQSKSGEGCTNVANISYYTKLLDDMNSLRRKVSWMFLTSPITCDNLSNMCVNRIPLPFDLLVFRPWMEYDTHSIIACTRADEMTDTTAVVTVNITDEMDALVRYIDRPDSVMPEFALDYHVSIPHVPANTASASKYMHSRVLEIVKVGIRGGGGTRFINRREDLEKIRANGGLERACNSLVACLVPRTPNSSTSTSSSDAYGPFVDIRGSHPMVNSCGYPGSETYRMLLGIPMVHDHIDDLGAGKRLEAYGRSDVACFNTICRNMMT